MNILLAGALQRVIEVGFRAAPTILVGLIVAAVFRHLLGAEGTRKLFTGERGLGLLKGWAIGMLLPVCSLGVIPVVREMRRAGVGGGPTIAFALTAPLFNPISVLYGLTLSDPVVLLAFCLGSLVIVTLLGALWDGMFPSVEEDKSTTPVMPYGWRRIAAMASLSAREAVGPTLGYSAIALLGIGVMTMLLPHGRLQTAVEHGDPWAPAVMAFVAFPLYAAPMTVMMQLASMFQHGNSIGAAFSLLTLGAGINLGTAIWLLRNYPPLRTALALGSLFGLVFLISYGFDEPLHDRAVESAGHTHAFDGYCNPFTPDTLDVMTRLQANLKEGLLPHELVAAGLLGLLGVVGGSLQRFDSKQRLENWLAVAPVETQKSWDIVIPGRVLGALALMGLIVSSVAGAFLYYPERSEVFAELQSIHAEVFSAANSGNAETALHWIPIYDDWARKLQVGIYLRGGSVSDYQRMKARVLLEQLERLEHDLEDGHLEEAKVRVRRLNAAYLRFRKAFASASESSSGLALR